jgi:hypothetical protein
MKVKVGEVGDLQVAARTSTVHFTFKTMRLSFFGIFN